MVEFKLHEVLVASISQVMIKSSAKGVKIVNNLAESLMNETLYGDGLRLQQVLADFLLTSVNFTPNGGQLGLGGKLTKDRLGESVQLAHLELRYENFPATCTGAYGAPPDQCRFLFFFSWLTLLDC